MKVLRFHNYDLLWNCLDNINTDFDIEFVVDIGFTHIEDDFKSAPGLISYLINIIKNKIKDIDKYYLQDKYEYLSNFYVEENDSIFIVANIKLTNLKSINELCFQIDMLISKLGKESNHFELTDLKMQSGKIHVNGE